MWFILLFLLLKSRQGYASYLIPTQLYANFNDFRIKLTVGFEQEFLFMVNQESPISRINKVLLTLDTSLSSTTLEEISEGAKCFNTITLDTYKISLGNFTFLITNNSLVSKEDFGSFSFSLSYHNTNQSIVHQLYEKRYIKHLSYAFVPGDRNKEKVSQMIFGGIPEEITQTKQKGKCLVPKDQFRWGCDLISLSFGSLQFNNNIYGFKMYFEASERKSYAPTQFINFLIEKVFKKEIAEGSCQVNKMKHINCTKDVIEAFPSIHISLGDYSYSLMAKEVFEVIYPFSYLLFYENSRANDTWVLSSSFLKHFDTLFDMEERAVYFYSDNRISTINQLIEKIALIMKITISLLMIGSLIIIMKIIFKGNKLNISLFEQKD